MESPGSIVSTGVKVDENVPCSVSRVGMMEWTVMVGLVSGRISPGTPGIIRPVIGTRQTTYAWRMNDVTDSDRIHIIGGPGSGLPGGHAFGEAAPSCMFR